MGVLGASNSKLIIRSPAFWTLKTKRGLWRPASPTDLAFQDFLQVTITGWALVRTVQLKMNLSAYPISRAQESTFQHWSDAVPPSQRQLRTRYRVSPAPRKSFNTTTTMTQISMIELVSWTKENRLTYILQLPIKIKSLKNSKVLTSSNSQRAGPGSIVESRLYWHLRRMIMMGRLLPLRATSDLSPPNYKSSKSHQKVWSDCFLRRRKMSMRRMLSVMMKKINTRYLRGGSPMIHHRLCK